MFVFSNKGLYVFSLIRTDIIQFVQESRNQLQKKSAGDLVSFFALMFHYVSFIIICICTSSSRDHFSEPWHVCDCCVSSKWMTCCPAKTFSYQLLLWKLCFRCLCSLHTHLLTLDRLQHLSSHQYFNTSSCTAAVRLSVSLKPSLDQPLWKHQVVNAVWTLGAVRPAFHSPHLTGFDPRQCPFDTCLI